MSKCTVSIESSILILLTVFFFSSRRRHTRFDCDWSSDVCSSDLGCAVVAETAPVGGDTDSDSPELPPPPLPPPPQPASTKAPRASTATERARRQRLTAPAEARAHGRDDIVKLPGDARLLPEVSGSLSFRT